MPPDPLTHPTFTPHRKWKIGFNVVLMSLLVTASVVMANYLSHQYFLRLYASTHTRVRLHSRTLHFLKSITNKVKVTAYYDQTDPLYSTILDLLNQYRLANPKITVQTVDFTRDPGGAQRIKSLYKLDSATDKNLIIFDCGGTKFKPVPGEALARYTLEQLPNEKERQFRRKPTEFLGEMMFTGALLDVTSPKPLNAYFLQGNGENEIQNEDDNDGYSKFAHVLQQNYIGVQPLSLIGTNCIPVDCNLLVIAGPKTAIPKTALEKIDRYLAQGGRLFALFSSASLDRETGLERLLAQWGVAVGNDEILDFPHSPPQNGYDIVVSAFSKHPAVNPLLTSGLYLVAPRPIGKLDRASAADSPRVEVLAMTGPQSVLLKDKSHPRAYPVMVAVEKGGIRGVIAERGTSRILVVGDSLLLANGQIDLFGNRDFAGYAVNWLLDRTLLLEGVGPRPVVEYTLIMTQSQMQRAQWILLGGMPAAVLMLGGLVWLRRRR